MNLEYKNTERITAVGHTPYFKRFRKIVQSELAVDAVLDYLDMYEWPAMKVLVNEMLEEQGLEAMYPKKLPPVKLRWIK